MTKGTLPSITSVIQYNNIELRIDTINNDMGLITIKSTYKDELANAVYQAQSRKYYDPRKKENIAKVLSSIPLLNIIKCESPAETRFFIFALGRINHLIPQVGIDKYRVDFGIKRGKIAIEIDGQDYHSSKKQREYDAKRDRYLQSKGWRIFHFTASEIYNDPNKCINEVEKLIGIFSPSEGKEEYSLIIDNIS